MAAAIADPLAAIVFLMSQHREYVNPLCSIPNSRDKTVLVSRDVENDTIPHEAGTAISCLDLTPVGPSDFFRDSIPGLKGPRSILLTANFPKSTQPRFGDDSH